MTAFIPPPDKYVNTSENKTKNIFAEQRQAYVVSIRIKTILLKEIF